MTNKLPNGGRLAHGQLHLRPERAGRSAPQGFGRYDGKPKTAVTTDPAITHGQKRQTKPSHEFLHGSPVDDEAMQKHYEGKQVPVTFGQRSRANGAQEADGFALLQEAGRLGAPVGSWRK